MLSKRLLIIMLSCVTLNRLENQVENIITRPMTFSTGKVHKQ